MLTICYPDIMEDFPVFHDQTNLVQTLSFSIYYMYVLLWFLQSYNLSVNFFYICLLGYKTLPIDGRLKKCNHNRQKFVWVTSLRLYRGLCAAGPKEMGATTFLFDFISVSTFWRQYKSHLQHKTTWKRARSSSRSYFHGAFLIKALISFLASNHPPIHSLTHLP